MDKISEFFEEQYLRSVEEREVRSLMEGGMTFEEAFYQVEKDWVGAFEAEEELPSEVESFSTTADWLRKGEISLDKPSRLK